MAGDTGDGSADPELSEPAGEGPLPIVEQPNRRTDKAARHTAYGKALRLEKGIPI